MGLLLDHEKVAEYQATLPDDWEALRKVANDMKQETLALRTRKRAVRNKLIEIEAAQVAAAQLAKREAQEAVDAAVDLTATEEGGE